MNRYISDLHFGHKNIIKLDRRPFSSVEEMEKELIRRWNNVVMKGDTTYILGDFCWGKEPEWRRITPLLNGNKVLIRGNHDLKERSSETKKLFQDIKDYKEIKDCGRKVILSHYPILLYKHSNDPSTYMLCGHVHDTKENDLLTEWRSELWRKNTSDSDNCGNIINVGCMLSYMNYTPRTLDELSLAMFEND